MTETTLDASELPASRLYTFIDEERQFAAYFLEGQRLVYDLALVHPIRAEGFAYFRDVVLSIQPMIALLKHGEQIGFYIDSKSPSFLLKIETAHHGSTRCMLLPEDFQQFPETMTGMVRLQKLFPGNRSPYESILEIDALPLRDLVNRVLRESYQVNSAVLVSQQSDQSLLLHQLPPLPRSDEYEYSLEALRERRDRISASVESLFARALVAPEEIEAGFREIGFRLLASREVAFRCSCSHERVLQGLRPVHQSDPTQLFEPDRDDLDVRCEYCKEDYKVTREELSRVVNPLN